MPVFLLRFLPHILALLAIVGGVLWYGQSRFNAGEAKVWALWNKERQAAQLTFEIEAAKAATLENNLDLAKWRIEMQLRPQLAAANAYGAGLAARLRHYYQSAGENDVRQTPIATPESAGAIGDRSDPGGVDDLVGRFIGSCKKDAPKLHGWREWWDAIPAEMKQ